MTFYLFPRGLRVLLGGIGELWGPHPAGYGVLEVSEASGQWELEARSMGLGSGPRRAICSKSDCRVDRVDAAACGNSILTFTCAISV